MVCSFKEQSSDFLHEAGNKQKSRARESAYTGHYRFSSACTESGITGNLALDNYVQRTNSHSNCYIWEEQNMPLLFKDEQAMYTLSSNTMQSSWLWQSYVYTISILGVHSGLSWPCPLDWQLISPANAVAALLERISLFSFIWKRCSLQTERLLHRANQSTVSGSDEDINLFQTERLF